MWFCEWRQKQQQKEQASARKKYKEKQENKTAVKALNFQQLIQVEINAAIN